jgi:hypothetical protein
MLTRPPIKSGADLSPHAGRGENRFSFSRCVLHPSYEHAIPKNLAAIPIFVRSIRQWMAGSITIGRGNQLRRVGKGAQRRAHAVIASWSDRVGFAFAQPTLQKKRKGSGTPKDALQA